MVRREAWRKSVYIASDDVFRAFYRRPNSRNLNVLSEIGTSVRQTCLDHVLNPASEASNLETFLSDLIHSVPQLGVSSSVLCFVGSTACSNNPIGWPMVYGRPGCEALPDWEASNSSVSFFWWLF